MSVQRAGLLKLKKVLRAVHKQFSCPPPEFLSEKSVDLYLEDPDFDEDKLRHMINSASSPEQVVNFALHSRRKENLSISKSGALVKIDIDAPAATKVSSAISSSKTPDRCLPGAGAEAENGPYTIVYENLYHLVAQVFIFLHCYLSDVLITEQLHHILIILYYVSSILLILIGYKQRLLSG